MGTNEELAAGAAKRVRITIPAQDEEVLRWLARQSNVSVSVRQVIREAVASYGYGDVTCTSVRGRGRPRKRDPYDEKYAAEAAEAAVPEGREDEPPEERPVAAPARSARPSLDGLPEGLRDMLP